MVLGADTGAGCVQDDGGGANQRRDRGPERDIGAGPRREQGGNGCGAGGRRPRGAARPTSTTEGLVSGFAWMRWQRSAGSSYSLMRAEVSAVSIDTFITCNSPGVPTCAAASTLTHTAAGVGEGRGQEGCRLVRPRQAPVRVLRVVHALASRVVRPAARAFLSRSSPMIAAPRGADGRGARARCRHPAPWSPRGRRREKRQLRPRHRVPPPR